MFRIFILSISIGICQVVHGQSLGGRNSFSFLRLPTFASQAALSGINVSQTDFEVNRWTANPALLTKDMDKHVSLSYVPYYAQIRYLSVVYADSFKPGRFGAALHYMDYGTFDETDASGNVIGTFQAKDYVLSVAHVYTKDSYSLGVTAKLIGSTLASYNGYAAAIDVGGLWKHPTYDWTIGLAIRNAGVVLRRYYPGATQAPLPFDVQLGTTFKPKFMPFRFSVTAHRLNQPDIAFDDPQLATTIDANGNTITKNVSFTDKVARHFTFGTELVLAKALYIRLGYNHLVRQEMKLPDRAINAGFSLGFMLKLKPVQLGYARFYQQAGHGVSYLTLTANLNTWIRKKDTHSSSLKN